MIGFISVSLYDSLANCDAICNVNHPGIERRPGSSAVSNAFLAAIDLFGAWKNG
jgi:hypothetical protein